jgi:hypothetical protein
MASIMQQVYKISKKDREFGDACGKRHHFFVLGGMPDPDPIEPLPELTDVDKVKIKKHVDIMRKHAPEFEQFVKDAMSEGMIPGYRALRAKAK